VSVFALGVFALLLPVASGPYLTLLGGRPDTVLAFMAAGLGESRSSKVPLFLWLFLILCRLLLGPRGSGGEVLGLAAVAVLFAAVMSRTRGGGGALLVIGCLAGYGLLLLSLFLWAKGSGRPADIPCFSALLSSFFLTLLFSLAFRELLRPGGAGRC